MPNNQNELAFQLWWFACYDHGCACVPHTFSLGLKKTTSYSMSLRTINCGGERRSMQKKETVKQSCSTVFYFSRGFADWGTPRMKNWGFGLALERILAW
jgi:hypothetical protein